MKAIWAVVRVLLRSEYCRKHRGVAGWCFPCVKRTR